MCILEKLYSLITCESFTYQSSDFATKVWAAVRSEGGRVKQNLQHWNIPSYPQGQCLVPWSGCTLSLLWQSCKHSKKKTHTPLVDENVDSELLFWMGEEQRWGALQLETDGFLICAYLWMSVCESECEQMRALMWIDVVVYLCNMWSKSTAEQLTLIPLNMFLYIWNIFVF